MICAIMLFVFIDKFMGFFFFCIFVVKLDPSVAETETNSSKNLKVFKSLRGWLEFITYMKPEVVWKDWPHSCCRG